MENYCVVVGIQSIVCGVVYLSISARNSISDCVTYLEMEIGFVCSLIFRIEINFFLTELVSAACRIERYCVGMIIYNCFCLFNVINNSGCCIGNINIGRKGHASRIHISIGAVCFEIINIKAPYGCIAKGFYSDKRDGLVIAHSQTTLE